MKTETNLVSEVALNVGAICIGNGGGHKDKAGGNIVRELMIKKYSETEILDVIIERMNEILYV